MNIFLEPFSLLVFAASPSTAPPHAPNYCGQTFCLELQPMLHAERKGFVTPRKDLMELDGRSWVRLTYDDLGAISLFGPLPSSAEASGASYDKTANEIVTHSCEGGGDAKVCHRYLISVSDNGVAKKPLACSVISFWPATAEGNAPDVKLGTRIDIAEKLAESCT